MSESKFTPGPWIVDAKASLSVRGSTGFVVASCGGYTNNQRADLDAELEANTQLIAAAPSLLTAVRMMLEAYDDGVQPDWAQPAIKASYAAIAKATASPMGKE